MKQIRTVALFALLQLLSGHYMSARAQASLWVSGYYRGQYQNTWLHAQDIDYTAVTHIIHFALLPRADATLDDQTRKVTAANADSLITLAHAAGKKVLVCVGGANSASVFDSATSRTNVSGFISNLLSLVSSRHYDGIDVDWENLVAADSAQYASFIRALRAAMTMANPQLILTAAVISLPDLFARLSSEFDQINIMTYHLSGPYAGWFTWHNAPIYDGGYTFADGRLVPSADGLVASFEASGVPPAKMGIGIDFYGAVWSGGSGTSTGGVTMPRQSWTGAPSVSYEPYYTVMDSYYHTQAYRWDSVADAAYLSIDSAGSSGDKFISYENQKSCLDKTDYVHKKGLGGLIIWDLTAGWRPSVPVPDSLLKTVKKGAIGISDVPDRSRSTAQTFAVSQCYPNPFNPSTTIEYTLPKASRVELKVYDMLGQDVATLVDGYIAPGLHAVRFDALSLPSGVYLYRLLAGNSIASGKMLLLK